MKKRILAGILVFVLLVGVGATCAGCSNKNNSNGSNGTNSENSENNENKSNNKELVAPKGVGAISSNNQKSGNTTFTNYLVQITNDIDWNTITKEEKQTIVNYVFQEIYRQNEEKDIKNFNITGLNVSGSPVFMYDRVQDEMVTLKNGEQEFRFPAPTKE